jgi:hypothetical protein
VTFLLELGPMKMPIHLKKIVVLMLSIFLAAVSYWIPLPEPPGQPASQATSPGLIDVTTVAATR